MIRRKCARRQTITDLRGLGYVQIWDSPYMYKAPGKYIEEIIYVDRDGSGEAADLREERIPYENRLVYHPALNAIIADTVSAFGVFGRGGWILPMTRFAPRMMAWAWPILEIPDVMTKCVLFLRVHVTQADGSWGWSVIILKRVGERDYKWGFLFPGIGGSQFIGKAVTCSPVEGMIDMETHGGDVYSFSLLDKRIEVYHAR